jgi:hypothetical protein
MRCLWGVALAAGLVFGFAAGIGRAGAEVVVAIDKSKQHLTVLLDGVEQHVWKVSTGLGGGPPSGRYKPERLERKWFSHKYGWSPMPHSIFFHKGYAIHGTIYLSRLGKRASHGCVRLHPANAATLFALVRSQGKGNTTIVVGNSAVALQQLLPRKEPPSRAEASAQKRVPAPGMPAADGAPTITGATSAAPPAAVPEFQDEIQE